MSDDLWRVNRRLLVSDDQLEDWLIQVDHCLRAAGQPPIDDGDICDLWERGYTPMGAASVVLKARAISARDDA